eukprot:scaffold78269_cov18-Tisochrysis_lutea.AAC.1
MNREAVLQLMAIQLRMVEGSPERLGWKVWCGYPCTGPQSLQLSGSASVPEHVARNVSCGFWSSSTLDSCSGDYKACSGLVAPPFLHTLR